MKQKVHNIISFFSFLSITFLIIGGDYFVTQKFSSADEKKERYSISEKTISINTNTNMKKINNIKNRTELNPSPVLQATQKPSPTAQIFINKNINYIQKIGTELIQLTKKKLSITPPYNSSFIFKIFPINREEHGLSISTIELRENISDTLSREYLKIYEFNIHEKTITEAYNTAKQSIIHQLKNNLEAKVVEVNKYGEKSFVIRLEKNQKTMYLVLASDDRLLGIEYSLGENFSRHRSIDTVLQSVFPLYKGVK